MSIVSGVPRSCKLWLQARFMGARARLVSALAYDENRLLTALRSVGVNPGDSVMLHSAFGPQDGFRGSIAQLTKVFVDAVGPDGHLLMVSLPYRSSSIEYLGKLKQFDVRKSPSMMGLVSEFFRRRPDVTRSLHPTHPVLVHGPRAAWFADEHPNCQYPCGPGSPFDRLAEADGKVVFYNVPFATYTFFHYLEHLVSPLLPFALYTDEPFHVPVVDRDGQARTVTTYVYSRETLRRRRFDVFEAALRRRGLIRQRRLGIGRIQAVRVRDTIECVMEMSRNGKFFYDLGDPPQRVDE